MCCMKPNTLCQHLYPHEPPLVMYRCNVVLYVEFETESEFEYKRVKQYIYFFSKKCITQYNIRLD